MLLIRYRSFPENSGDFPIRNRFSFAEKLEKKRSRIAPVNLNTEKFREFEKKACLNVDSDINASRKVEFLELVHRLCGRLDNVDHALVCALFKLVHGLLVNMG